MKLPGKVNNQQIFLGVIIIWIVVSCIGGIIAGIVAAPNFIEPKKIIITEITVYELAITQLVGGPTYTPYPSYTPLPVTPSILPTKTARPSRTPSPTPLPSITPTHTPVGFELLSFSWSVYAGEQAFLQIKTQTGVKCSISYTSPAEIKIDLPELASQLSNEKGECSWTWKIDSRSPLGTGTVVVTALNQSQTYYLQILKPTPTP